ncbi:hypothetical protein M406DRAFT_102816 [Cryphonectria parasitica EP155]|uniref:Uncharacterized protein n=1 Tax=Cryphonectria parasitica (strain ATCC 38755 / EP155) TaxID=660469 RepID=A0A9P4Y921_CRYP1|nr:uncharacterized protein M406DRAFT_102816 [Cryphonectria parasitica EP155]KAF3768743.1 hypothetical protein M406DRAFT_102816 [Cryphonectria parasitica EP155]
MDPTLLCMQHAAFLLPFSSFFSFFFLLFPRGHHPFETALKSAAWSKLALCISRSRHAGHTFSSFLYSSVGTGAGNIAFSFCLLDSQRALGVWARQGLSLDQTVNIGYKIGQSWREI